jgi:SAM-dependent methyltransferase
MMARSKFWTAQIANRDEYLEFLNFMGDEFGRHAEIEQAAIEGKQPFSIEGHCGVCDKPSKFAVTFEHAGDRDVPNWREHLNCQWCTLNNRMRASVQLASKLLGERTNPNIYVTEQITPLFRFFEKIYPSIIGSEFLNDATLLGQSNDMGVRFEDLTRLTFDSDSFDAVFSFDVLEHIPNYRAAIAEVYRCLRPEGIFLWSAPFDYGFPEKTAVRATVSDDGTIVNHLPAEFHGDPLTDGVLCYQHFGLDILDDMRSVGFKSANMHLYWSRNLAYLGGLQYAVVGIK